MHLRRGKPLPTLRQITPMTAAIVTIASAGTRFTTNLNVLEEEQILHLNQT